MRKTKPQENGLKFQDLIYDWICDRTDAQYYVGSVSQPFDGSSPVILKEKSVQRGSRADIVFYDPWCFRWGLFFKAKFQETSGSAADKLAYSNMVAAEHLKLYPNVSSKVVCHGKQFKPSGSAMRKLEEIKNLNASLGVSNHLMVWEDFQHWFKNAIEGAGGYFDV